MRKKQKKIKNFDKNQTSFYFEDYLETNKKNKILKNLRKVCYIREHENHSSLRNYSRITLTSKSNFKKIIKEVKNAL